MKQAATRALFAYWNQLRGARSAPERADIDPAAIRAVLSDTFILEVADDLRQPAFPFRLCGTRLNALFLAELKGRSMVDLWSEEDRPAILRLLGAVLDDCTPAVCGVRAGPRGHDAIELEMLLLPLRHHGRTHARLMGCVTAVGAPSWFGLMPVQHLTLSSLRLIDEPSAEMITTDTAMVASLGQGGGGKRYGNFVVHQGGR